MKKLTKFEFEAFGHPERPPLFHSIVKEHEWYSDDEERSLGVVFRDRVDGDWGWAILSRGPEGKFILADIEASIPSLADARTLLRTKIEVFERNSTEGSLAAPAAHSAARLNNADPFKPVVPLHRLNPLFRVVAEHGAFSPARGMIREVYQSHVDADGNFIEQFQTTGFDSRIWELYLHAYLVDVGFSLLPSIRPDFLVSKGGARVGIEAVTANPTQDSPGIYRGSGYPSLIPPNDKQSLVLDASFVDKGKDFVPIKLGSALYSKLGKRYWEAKGMPGRSLILAIETFHDRQSLHYASTALATYLYGYRWHHLWTPEGTLVVVPQKIESHSYAGKTIPSGFFSLPETQNISAVLFSNSGTISKFNRMGQLGKHRNPKIRLFRQGLCYDADPIVATPLEFRYDVEDPRCREWWGQGLEMFHNPFALLPVDRRLFPGIAHHRLEKGQMYTAAPAFQPFASVTLNFSSQK